MKEFLSKRKYLCLIILLILITFLIRIYFAYQTPYFDLESYFSLRQIENIKNHGSLILDDPLSYNGRIQLISPLFYYILGFFNLFFPLSFVAKIIPNLFAVSSIYLIFLLSKEFTDNDLISFIVAFFGAFSPFFFIETFNSVSIHSLFIPLMLLMIYFIFNLDKSKKFVIGAIILSFLLPLLSTSSFLLIIIFIFYLILLKLVNLEPKESEKELILFYTFVTIWINFLIFKDAFLIYGVSLIWQNIPKQITNQFFSNINLLDTLYLLGVIPTFAAIYTIYNSLLIEKKKQVYLLLSLLITLLILIWLRTIRVMFGFIFLSIIIVLIFPLFLKFIFEKFNQTKLSKFSKLFVILVFIVLIFNSLIPTISTIPKKLNSVPSEELIQDFEWIKNNTKEDSTILTLVKQGHLLNFISNRKNVADNNFLLISDVDQIILDIDTMYSSVFQVPAVKLLEKYDVDYIYLSKEIKEEYNLEEELRYFDNKCFEKLGPKRNIIKVKCKVEQI